MKKVILVVCLLFAATTLSARESASRLKGSGKIVTETRDAKAFNSIDVSNAIRVTMSENPNGKIIVKADDNVMPYVKTKFEGQTLVIKLECPYKSLGNVNMDVELPYSKNLRKLDISGASSVKIEYPIENNELDIKLSGASKAVLSSVKVSKLEAGLSGASDLVISSLSADECDVDLSGASRASFAGLDSSKFDGDISGASDLSIQGASEFCDIEACGASSVKAGDFTVKNCKVDLSGASRAKINCVESLSGEVSGASHLTYFGSPKTNVSTSSGGSITAKKRME